MLRIQQLGEHCVAMTGRLDASQAALADAELRRITHSVVIDLGALEYISSAGIGVLVGAQIRLKETGQQLRIVNPHPRVLAVLHFANLEAFFGLE